MLHWLRTTCYLFLTITGLSILLAFSTRNAAEPTPSFHFPYKQAGLTEREAAAYLLSRFSYGARPGQVDEVVKMGLEKWFNSQLEANLPDDSVNAMLSGYTSLTMTNAEIASTYPRNGQILKMALNEGIIDTSARANRKDYRQELKVYMEEKGYHPQQELFRELINQKILRAAYSNNQLKEVLTDFWFNHFNVSLTKGADQQFVTAYERDAIRPNVLGSFENLLLATAKSPAMLTYLDNFQSMVNEDSASLLQQRMQERKFGKKVQALNNANGKIKKPKAQGLNENYAREIMELHTLGVDGGYTQADVTEAARILTGWTLHPMGGYGNGQGLKAMERLGTENMQKLGFVEDGDFLFAANRHDGGEKNVMGNVFPAGSGYEEGLKLLHLLATHPSTAKFISRKLAVRFLSDAPPQLLIDKMAKTFQTKNGDIKEVLTTMATSPEFWNKSFIRDKTKSPFELAISSVRSLNAKIDAPYQLYTWITKMGQQVYFYQAPTGFPDKGQYWINTGSLLNRMNFGLALATERIPGVHVNLIALNKNHEPESAEAALEIYSRLLLPERNVEETIKRLKPMLSDPELTKKIDEAAGKTAKAPVEMMDDTQGQMMDNKKPGKKNKESVKKPGGKKEMISGNLDTKILAGNNTMLAQVTGIIIGSPEFQRK